VDVTQIEHALLVVLDVPNFERIDGINGLQYDAILKIDHHPPLDIVGDVDWTDDTKSSTCEMLINLLLDTKLVIDLKIANALYTGMVFDSDRFLLGTTTVGTFLTVTKLLNKLPVDITSVYNNLYYKDMSELKFYAYLINNIVISDNKFGYIFIEKETLDKFGMDASSPSHFVNDFYYINQLVCWAFATYDERLQLYKVNIRSCGPDINEIANKYDGGGHKLASGCRIKKKSDVEALMKDLDAASKVYNDNE
jgi:phosphoesterase RecJ-like protein